MRLVPSFLQLVFLPLLPLLFAASAHAELFSFFGKSDQNAENVIATRELKAGDAFFDCDTCPEMVVVPGGRFRMGSTEYPAEQPVRTVTVKTFAIGKFEVSQRQWEALMGANPSHHQPCGACPVERVTWDEARIYVQRLSLLTGKSYRLPSEAEWEYACRAGGEHRYCGGDELEAVAWTDGNSNGFPQPVGRRRANAFGLYDMSGNVWEWVADCWKKNYEGAPEDGSARDRRDCRQRVLRGGSWIDLPLGARASERGFGLATRRDDGDGFRVAVAVELPAGR